MSEARLGADPILTEVELGEAGPATTGLGLGVVVGGLVVLVPEGSIEIGLDLLGSVKALSGFSEMGHVNILSK